MPKTWLAITRNSPNTPYWDIIAIGHNKAQVRQAAIESETYRPTHAYRTRLDNFRIVSKTSFARDCGVAYSDNMLSPWIIDLREETPKWLAITKIHDLADWWYVVTIGYTPDGAYITAIKLLKDMPSRALDLRVVDGNSPALPYEIRYEQPAIDLRLG